MYNRVKRRVTLIHHAANRGHPYPPNSLSALRACLEADARVVEVDITPLRDGHFAMLHDIELEAATDGTGYTFATSTAEITRLHYTNDDNATDEPVALLSQAISLVRRYPRLQELQLDLKPHAPLTNAVLTTLLRLTAPVKKRVRVSSVADWSVRRLHELDPDLALGFDPVLYLDMDGEKERLEGIPPVQIGAYGYRDDHRLAKRRWGPVTDYLAARAKVLATQVPPGTRWFIRARLLSHALEDDFDWIAFLNAGGADVGAWTLDADRPGQLALAQRLVDAGVDHITTNDAPRLARELGTTVEF